MRALIVSDTHGRQGNLELALRQTGRIDLMIHCGDVEDGENEIRSLVDCEVRMVRGNNDFFSYLERENVFRVGRYWAFLTHGHTYYVNMGLGRLKQAALERGASIAIFGHTHRPLIDQSGSVVLINPGSISQPRQEDRRPSYIIMETDRQGEPHFTLHYL